MSEDRRSFLARERKPRRLFRQPAGSTETFPRFAGGAVFARFPRLTPSLVRWLVILAAFVAWPPTLPRGQNGAKFRVDDVKATFVYKFINYLQWPGQEPTAPVRIGVIGKDGVLRSLQEISRRLAGPNRAIVVKGYHRAVDFEKSDILFISGPELKSLPKLLEKTGAAGLFTISDQAGGLPPGICLNFVSVNEQIRFEVNLKTLKASGVQASSNLLKLASRIVGKE